MSMPRSACVLHGRGDGLGGPARQLAGVIGLVGHAREQQRGQRVGTRQAAGMGRQDSLVALVEPGHGWSSLCDVMMHPRCRIDRRPRLGRPAYRSCCRPNSWIVAVTSSSVCLMHLSEPLGRRRHGDRAGVLDHGRVVGRRDDRHDLAIEPVDDRLRGALGGADAEPAEPHVVDPGLLQGRNLRHLRQALRRRDGEQPELLGFILRHDPERRRDVEIDAPGDHFLHDLRSAPERNPVHGDAGELLELPRQDLLRRSRADRRIADLTGVRFGVLHERREILGRNPQRQREPVIVFGDQRDRRDIVEPEPGIRIGRGVDRFEMRAKKQRVAVPRLRQHVPGGQHAGGDGLVLDQHPLPQPLSELVGDEAGRNVGRPAGPEADDEADRLDADSPPQARSSRRGERWPRARSRSLQPCAPCRRASAFPSSEHSTEDSAVNTLPSPWC